jgi:DNA-binding transcriptional LysR family regulator
MRFTLRQLQVFLEVARVESVSRAAAALAMSQSAVSGALGDLERQFDVQLFDRLGKRLQLSALGRAVRGPAEATLDQARELERALADRKQVGRLRQLIDGLNALAAPVASASDAAPHEIVAVPLPPEAESAEGSGA